MDDVPNYDDDFFEVDSIAGNFVRLSHLNNKSSVLSPESRNITSQYLALQQLDAHQRMISRAKSTVDTSAPKSLQSYISVVNQQKKKSWRRSNNESRSSNMENLDYDFRPATSSRMQNSISEEDDNLSLNTSVNKGIQTGIPFGNFSSKTADKISWYLEALRHGELHSPFFMGTESSKNFHQSQASNRNRKKIIKGDILDWHTDCFVKPSKPFSPRIIANTNAKSKLKDMRCYNPPFRKKKHSSSHSSDTFESYDQEDESNEEEDESQQSSGSSSIAKEIQMNRGIHSESIPNYEPTTPSFHLHPRDHFESFDHFRSLKRTFDHAHFYAENDNEEDKYLNFLSKVTEDILRSGVYSDKAIKQAFDFHMQFYQDEANKDKLQSLLSQVLDGLKISGDESEEIPNWRNPLINFSRPNSPPEKENRDALLDTRTDTEPNSRTFDDSNFHSMNQTTTDDIQSDRNISQDNPSNQSENES
ncbi:spermatogenesis-associated protein 7-like isoform X2 [Argiope bruennichi]|uniref:spermatogenesis-associated protein 7-like isoform X2 n=1 Tax=Argiope bruennichi TaxID=94029 RepID=UPI00249531BB|nr:spermatogenesis-associated protein 7-like isoform X2 [Argiope bruennichi]